jgi:hypothetical protein
MSQVCRQCSHANPAEAVYCYHDGVLLAGHSANGGPIRAGSQPFPHPFVFPSGQVCGNFDQLALACQQQWQAAAGMLQNGFLTSFLGGMGRADLALAAQEAAHFPDIDRGLDQLLAKLPSQVLQAPHLRIEPTEINLGVLQQNANRQFDLHLSNLGARLVYGSVTADSKWLTLGEGAGQPQRIFQFGSDAVITVQVRGQFLRSGQKTLEGRLIVESNGGSAAVVVRADVPIKPYPAGVLAGATTPRQIAEKAREFPKEAAPLFESGAVARWFADNGWTYPVQGPLASGIGAVQQFFEALGLAKAPRVEISQAQLALRGLVGEALQATVELKSQEKRPVYAHGVGDQPWLEVGQAQLSGRSATLAILVPRVPRRPGETLQANAVITANGNQKFTIPVSLTIDGSAEDHEDLLPASSPLDQVPLVQAFAVPSTPSIDLADALQKSPATIEPPVALVAASSAAGRPAAMPSVVAHPAHRAQGEKPGSAWPAAVRLALHALPAAILFGLLLLVVAHDLFLSQPAADEIPLDPRPRLVIAFDDDGLDEAGKRNSATMRFGLSTRPLNPKQPSKKLTFDNRGKTNSTVLKINGRSRMFGLSIPGESQWLRMAEPTADGKGTKSVWAYTDRNRPSLKLEITQLVELVAGEPIENRQGQLHRYLDTCRVRYLIANKGQEVVDVGLRILIDTLIGEDDSNDGVPFTVPGLHGLVTRSAHFESPHDTIPDFLQVLEVPNLKNPGIVGFMNLKLGSMVEPPQRVLLTHWTPNLNLWEIPERSIAEDVPDSAVVLFWADKPLAQGQKRELGFSYGLGILAIANGQLGVSVGGNFTPHGDLTTVALINNPEKGQTVTLKLPQGLVLVEGDATQSVPAVPAGAAVQQSPVTWRIRAQREGNYVIEVQSSTGVTQKKPITIRAKTLF